MVLRAGFDRLTARCAWPERRAAAESLERDCREKAASCDNRGPKGYVPLVRKAKTGWHAAARAAADPPGTAPP